MCSLSLYLFSLHAPWHQAPSAWEGREVLRRLQEACDEEKAHVAHGEQLKLPWRTSYPVVIAAAGVSASNVAALAECTGIQEFHAGSALMEDRPGRAHLHTQTRSSCKEDTGKEGAESGGGAGPRENGAESSARSGASDSGRSRIATGSCYW